VLSSHLLSELERVADHLVLMSGGRVRLDGAVDDLLAVHRLVTTGSGLVSHNPGWQVVESHAAGAQTQQLVRLGSPETVLPAGCDARSVGIEELAMAYLRTSSHTEPVLEGALR
jgi:ABC-2 type transport system ATP-binding protein